MSHWKTSLNQRRNRGAMPCKSIYTDFFTFCYVMKPQTLWCFGGIFMILCYLWSERKMIHKFKNLWQIKIKIFIPIILFTIQSSATDLFQNPINKYRLCATDSQYKWSCSVAFWFWSYALRCTRCFLSDKTKKPDKVTIAFDVLSLSFINHKIFGGELTYTPFHFQYEMYLIILFKKYVRHHASQCDSCSALQVCIKIAMKVGGFTYFHISS